MSRENFTNYDNETEIVEVKKDLDGFSFFQTLFLSLCIVSSIILFSTVVYYVMKKKALDELRHRLVPLYHFDPGETEDWEDELLDEYNKDKSRNALHSYRSMSSPTVTT